jgi:hypothetical protein
MIAVLTFRWEERIDNRSGLVEMRLMLFPFSVKWMRMDGAFETFFGRCAGSRKDWAVLDTGGFVPSPLRATYTGSTLWNAMGDVVQVMRLVPLSPSDQQRISSDFYRELDLGGPTAAASFADDLLQKTVVSKWQHGRTNGLGGCPIQSTNSIDHPHPP